MFVDKVVVVTGAGAGLGLALVQEFLKQGAKVAGVGRSENSSFQPAPDQLERFMYFQADISQPTQVVEATEAVMKKFGRVDYLFNNAAIYQKTNFTNESIEQFMATMNTNVGGVAAMSKAVLPSMLRQRYGRIINVGSFADRGVTQDSAAYCASKGALHALTKGIAVDLESLGANIDIQVHEWIPGELNTKMGHANGLDPKEVAAWAPQLLGRNNAKSEVFVGNELYVPAVGLKQRLKNKLLFWR